MTDFYSTYVAHLTLESRSLDQVLPLPDDDDGVVGEELYIPGGPGSATS